MSGVFFCAIIHAAMLVFLPFFMYYNKHIHAFMFLVHSDLLENKQPALCTVYSASPGPEHSVAPEENANQPAGA